MALKKPHASLFRATDFYSRYDFTWNGRCDDATGENEINSILAYAYLNAFNHNLPSESIKIFEQEKKIN